MCIRDRYAPDYNFEAEEEFEKEWQDYRKMLMKTFSKVVRYSPERAAQFVMDSVETAIQHWNTMPFAQVELAPVSYTHLRAHETPEHLVCRLLLEKKKKKNNNYITNSPNVPRKTRNIT
eukprot:TRINITY_DN14996_c0_g1_i5.p2 TRINITY_DN14996_c0_g1~~TRINITY_DN14996_c0_g1_i5.p2  ORF type:complete len:119 (-),score=45.42 TRINITY_DN14996_c0_g1_i5:27-383(-)